MEAFNTLYDFVDRAVKSRKYPESTSYGLKAALKLFEGELNDEEKGSVDRFTANIEQIYKSVVSKNGKNFSAGSLATYKSRVMKVLNDYDKYGRDATKMNGWSPKVITRTRKAKVSSEEIDDSSLQPVISSQANMLHDDNTHRIELALRPEGKFVLVVPRDINQLETKKIKAILDSLCVDKRMR